MKLLLACFCFLATFLAIKGEKSMGPVGKIITNSIYSCKEKPETDDISLKAEIKTLDDKGSKGMNANYNSKIAIDETIEHNLVVSKWESGGWKVYYTLKGKFCVDAQKFFPKIWTKLRAAVKPSIPLPCPVKAGKYSLDKFQVTTEDLTLPSIFYGKFMAKLQLFKNKKMIMCVQGEGDSEAP